jgi:hypothetical protein
MSASISLSGLTARCTDIRATKAQVRDKFIDYFQRDGGVMELPFALGRNITYMVVPAPLIHVAQEVTDAHPKLITLHTAAKREL